MGKFSPFSAGDQQNATWLTILQDNCKGKVGQVCKPAKWPTRLELIPGFGSMK